MTQQESLFDLIESEADLNIFFDREGFKAKGAAIIITSSPVGHFPKDSKDHFTVWFGHGITKWSFKDFSTAINKVAEILKSPKSLPLTYRFTGKKEKLAIKLLEKEGITSSCLASKRDDEK